MALTQRLFASRSLSTTVVVYGGGGGMEPAAPIVVVDSGVVDGGNGGKDPTPSIIIVDNGNCNHCRLWWGADSGSGDDNHRRRWSSLTQVAVEWS
jgi:hypothetical protein